MFCFVIYCRYLNSYKNMSFQLQLKNQMIWQQWPTVPQGKNQWRLRNAATFRLSCPLELIILYYFIGVLLHSLRLPAWPLQVPDLQFLLWNKFWKIKRQTASNNNFHFILSMRKWCYNISGLFYNIQLAEEYFSSGWWHFLPRRAVVQYPKGC